MKKNHQTIPFQTGEKVIVRAHGTFDARGNDLHEIEMLTDLRVQRIEHSMGVMRFLFVDDCEMTLPSDTSLVIDRASQNARVRDMLTPLSINKVNGNLALINIDAARVDQVSGTCLVQQVKGELKITRIHGHLKGEGVRGTLVADRVSGSVELGGLSAGAKIRANGNIRASFSSSSLEEIVLISSSDIQIALPQNIDATVIVVSNGRKIEVDLPDHVETVRSRNHTFTLGEGKRKILLDASGKVKIIRATEEDLEMKRLFDELDELWDELKKESELRREAKSRGIPFELQMVDGVAQIAEQAMTGAMRAINDTEFTTRIAREVTEKAEMRIQVALRRVEQEIRNLGYELDIPTPPYTPTPPDISQAPGVNTTDIKNEEEVVGSHDGVSAEERLVIMRMLQEKKITIEEADKLLRALEETAED